MSQVLELWFNDGTVVLQAEQKLFCLHGGLLSARSDIFRQILEDRNYDALYGVTRDVYINGRVLIKLPDAAQDAHNFFRAIYDVVPGFFEAPPAPVTMEVVLGILKMSTAYGVHALRRRALAHLNTAYPLTLQEWDARLAHGTVALQRQTYTAAGTGESTFGAAYAVLKTAKRAHAPWLLPVAFYNCCASHLDVIMDHFARVRAGRAADPVNANASLDADADEDEELKSTIIRGAFAHLEATREILGFLYLPPADACRDPTGCLEIRRVCMANIYASYPGNDPLAIWEDRDDWEAYLEGMCSACTEACAAVHYREREAFWGGLPGATYGMAYNWTVLRELYIKEMVHNSRDSGP